MLFSKLKAKQKSQLEEYCYGDNLLEILTSMFEYKNLPKGMEKEFLEGFLLTHGKVAFYELDGILICSTCTFIGDLNTYGRPKDLLCITENGKSTTFKDWENNENVVVVFNSTYHTPDLNICRYANFLAEVDKSLRVGITNTRFSKLCKAKNSSEKALLDNAIQGNENGVPQVIVSSNLLEETENGIIELTSPNDTDKLQYLSRLHEDFMRRFFNLYGMTTQGSEKMAQMSEKEINNGSNSSMIIPCDRLEERKKGIEKVNEIFGTEIAVDFSECWKREKEKREREVKSNDTDK